MSLHFIEIAKAMAPDAHTTLVLDAAGWHVNGKIIGRDNTRLIILKP